MRLLAVLIAAAAPSFAPALATEMPARPAPGHDSALAAFRAPRVVPSDIVSLPAPVAKAAIAQEPGGRTRVATVRALPKAARIEQWTPVEGGFVAKLRAASEDAQGLRVKLDLGAVPGALEIRVQGADGRVESMVADPVLGAEAWTPWTEGASQVIEVFSRFLPAADALRIGAVAHFTASPFAKAAGSCTLPTMCAPTDNALGSGVASAIGDRKKSVTKLQFFDGASGFVCTGTLINTEKFPAPFVLTANHCINNASAALSLTTFWFHESTACDGAIVSPNRVQVSGGAQLVFGNRNVDSTLLRMNQSAPSGSVFSGFNFASLAPGSSIVSISHPDGDTSRYAIGNTTREYQIIGYPQRMDGVRFTRGITQGGSSGSGLFTMAGGTLQLRGVLSGSTVRNDEEGLSCTNLDEEALYTRFETLYPQIAQYINNAAVAADDAPNRAQDWANVGTNFDSLSAPLNTQPNGVAIDARRIDYPGDLDVFRFTVTATSVVTVWTEGADLDTVGSILDSRGVSLETNDDAQTASLHTGLTRRLTPGTYYFQVGHFTANGTGAYNLRMRADAAATNYTDLWWNAAESGWGININHQGNTLFATLFTYDASGVPMWLVMSEGARQADGSFQGTLYRATGPAFNATTFLAPNLVAVGSMHLAFSDATQQGSVTYTFNGTQVTKAISRQLFGMPPTCKWSWFDRSIADNYQDLWWNPSEPGWGVNIAHQGDKLFATLFTYDTNHQGLWLVMSSGAETSPGRFSGTLYRTSGPAFNAVPWTPATPTAVGTMSFDFTHGNSGTITYTFNGVTVTKSIERQVFAPLKTVCESESGD